MTTRFFFSALSFIVLTACLFSCKKEIQEPIVETVSPTLPEGNRILIHFGTSTQQGCMYSFSNCIWIGWGHATELNREYYTLQFDNGEEVAENYGNYFPLTADYTLDAQNGLPAQIIRSGLYPFQLLPNGKKMIAFEPQLLQPVTSLVNPNNPQDNLGQLHNLAMQSIYTSETSKELEAAGVDQKTARSILTQKSALFLETEAGIVLSDQEQNQIKSAALESNYDNHTAWLETSKLSPNDRKVLGNLLDLASSMPVNSPEQLSQFVQEMTAAENQLANSTTLDNPTLVMSAVSVMKYSRYYWFWKSYSNDETPARQDWWKADVKGLIQGGIGQALVDSLFAAFTK